MYARESSEEGGFAPEIRERSDMTGVSKASEPQSPKVSKVLNYRRAVTLLCRALLELAESGRISESSMEKLKEFSRG